MKNRKPKHDSPEISKHFTEVRPGLKRFSRVGLCILASAAIPHEDEDSGEVFPETLSCTKEMIERSPRILRESPTQHLTYQPRQLEDVWEAGRRRVKETEEGEAGQEDFHAPKLLCAHGPPPQRYLCHPLSLTQSPAQIAADVLLLHAASSHFCRAASSSDESGSDRAALFAQLKTVRSESFIKDLQLLTFFWVFLASVNRDGGYFRNVQLMFFQLVFTFL